MIKSRFVAIALGLALSASLTTACGSKKTAETRGKFPQETELSASTDAAANSAADAANAANAAADQAAADAAAAAEAAAAAANGVPANIPFDPDTLSISEPGGKSLGEAGEAIPELTPVYFPLDSYELGESAKTLLGRAATYLKSNPDLYVVLRGHCDDTGTEEYNLALGSQRAQAVRKHLIDQGIGAIRLETLSFGETMPASEGTDEASRAQNRRVEFFVYTLTK